MSLDIPRIVDGLRFLREADRELAVFGASGHEYKLRPRLNEAAVSEFEARYSIRLPEDYRHFLIELGNGGAGPYYGILGLDQLDEIEEGYWNDMSKPFPYSHQWKGPPDLLKAMNEASEDKDRCYELRRGKGEDPHSEVTRGDSVGERVEIQKPDCDEHFIELVDEYWRLASRDGSINICDYGCNLRFILILNGPECGRIWFDATADLAGFAPVRINPILPIEQYGKWCITGEDVPAEDRVHFAPWYHCWLDWACRLVAKEAK